MRRSLIFVFIIAILIITGALIYKNQTKKDKEISMPRNLEKSEGKPLVSTKAGKKIAMIVAFRDFRDEEYFLPREIFEEAGAEIKIASNEKGRAIGADGGEVEVDLLIEEINPANFDAVVFIGGPGAIKYLDNDKSYQVAQETIKTGKVLAAICISPTILAKAGVLEGKKATVWSSPLDRSPIKILEENGAVYQDENVVEDGKIITANGPAAAKSFGEAIIEILKQLK